MRYITDGRTHKHKVRNSACKAGAGLSMKKESIVVRKMSVHVVVVFSLPCISEHTTIGK